MEDFLEYTKDEEEIKTIKKYVDLIKKEKNMSEKEIFEEFKKLKEELDSIISDTETLFEILIGRLGIKKEEKKESTEKQIKEVKEGGYVIVKGKVLSVRVSERFSSMKIYDETGSIRVVTFEPDRFKEITEGSIIKITDAFVRETDYGKELVVGKRTKIEIIEKREFPRKKLKDIKENEFIESVVFLAKVYEPKIVERKIEKDNEEITIERTITPLLLMDETSNIMAYFEGKVSNNLEGKTLLIRGRSFKSQKEDIRLNLRTLIEIDTEDELISS
jgi:hypothetical protein